MDNSAKYEVWTRQPGFRWGAGDKFRFASESAPPAFDEAERLSHHHQEDDIMVIKKFYKGASLSRIETFQWDYQLQDWTA